MNQHHPTGNRRRRQGPASPPVLPAVTEAVRRSPSRLLQHLCRSTVPHGGEAGYYGHMLSHLGFRTDAHDNWFVASGDKPTTAFMAHLDTAGRVAQPIHQIVRCGLLATDGTTSLGADDRSGVAILIYLLSRDVPGLYCLFAGEECGCLGSRRSARDPERYAGITRAVSFDRRGQGSVITHQCGTRTCSDEFAQALSRALNAHGLNYAPDPTGVFTDSLEFIDSIDECTNLSVGYEHEHTVRETQDLRHLDALAQACATLDWQTLPVVRTAGDNDALRTAHYDV